MSISLVLQGVRDYLRAEYQWRPEECGVTPNAEPIPTAGQFFVGIEQSGVETGLESTDSLKETFTVEIGIWRRAGSRPPDRFGTLHLPSDLYLANAHTLHELQRKVVVSINGQGGLHKNYRFLTFLNSLFGLPNLDDGPDFTTPLQWLGGQMRPEGIQAGQNDNGPAFIGYRLRFRGLLREQLLRGSRSNPG